jgi:hypothetical protein
MDQSIWAIYDSFNSVSTILQRDHFTLADVLSHESVIQDAKFAREAVIDYFKKPQILKKMIELITFSEPRYPTPEHLMKQKIQYEELEREYGSGFKRFPHICTEILANSTVLIQAIISNPELLTLFFDFLKNNTPPLNPSCTGYFRRLCTALLAHDNQKLIDIITSANLIPDLIAHLDSYSIMELIIMTGWDDGLRQFENPVWIYSSGLLDCLFACLGPDWELPENVQISIQNGLLTPEQVQTYRNDIAVHAGRIFIDLIIKCPDSHAVDWLLENETIDQLLSYGLSSSEATSGSAISLLILLSQHVLSIFQQENHNQVRYQQYITARLAPNENYRNNPQFFKQNDPTGSGLLNPHNLGKNQQQIAANNAASGSSVMLRWFFKPVDSYNSGSPLEPIYQFQYGIDCGQKNCKHTHVHTNQVPTHFVDRETYVDYFNLANQQEYLLTYMSRPVLPPTLPPSPTSFSLHIPPVTDHHNHHHHNENNIADYQSWLGFENLPLLKLPSNYIIEACRYKLPELILGVKPNTPPPTHIHSQVCYGNIILSKPSTPVSLLPPPDPTQPQPPLVSKKPCQCSEIPLFGDTRMKLTELVSILFCDSDPSFIPLFHQTDTFNILFSLFFYYPWHTLLHSMIETVVYYLGRSMYVCHPHYLFLYTNFFSDCKKLFEYNLVYVQDTLSQGLCLDVNLARQFYDVSLYQEKCELMDRRGSTVEFKEKDSQNSEKIGKNNDKLPQPSPYESEQIEDDPELALERLAVSQNSLPAVSYTAISNLRGTQITSPERPLEFADITSYSTIQYRRLSCHPYYNRFTASALRTNQCRTGCIAFLSRILSNTSNVITDQTFSRSLDPNIIRQLHSQYRYLVDVYCALPPAHTFYKHLANQDNVLSLGNTHDDFGDGLGGMAHDLSADYDNDDDDNDDDDDDDEGGDDQGHYDYSTTLSRSTGGSAAGNGQFGGHPGARSGSGDLSSNVDISDEDDDGDSRSGDERNGEIDRVGKDENKGRSGKLDVFASEYQNDDDIDGQNGIHNGDDGDGYADGDEDGFVKPGQADIWY